MLLHHIPSAIRTSLGVTPLLLPSLSDPPIATRSPAQDGYTLISSTIYHDKISVPLKDTVYHDVDVYYAVDNDTIVLFPCVAIGPFHLIDNDLRNAPHTTLGTIEGGPVTIQTTLTSFLASGSAMQEVRTAAKTRANQRFNRATWKIEDPALMDPRWTMRLVSHGTQLSALDSTVSLDPLHQDLTFTLPLHNNTTDLDTLAIELVNHFEARATTRDLEVIATEVAGNSSKLETNLDSRHGKPAFIIPLDGNISLSSQVLNESWRYMNVSVRRGDGDQYVDHLVVRRVLDEMLKSGLASIEQESLRDKNTVCTFVFRNNVTLTNAFTEIENFTTSESTQFESQIEQYAKDFLSEESTSSVGGSASAFGFGGSGHSDSSEKRVVNKEEFKRSFLQDCNDLKRALGKGSALRALKVEIDGTIRLDNSGQRAVKWETVGPAIQRKLVIPLLPREIDTPPAAPIPTLPLKESRVSIELDIEHPNRFEGCEYGCVDGHADTYGCTILHNSAGPNRDYAWKPNRAEWDVDLRGEKGGRYDLVVWYASSGGGHNVRIAVESLGVERLINPAGMQLGSGSNSWVHQKKFLQGAAVLEGDAVNTITFDAPGVFPNISRVELKLNIKGQ